MGEDTSTTIAQCHADGDIKVIRSYSVDESLGYFYEVATEYAGFTRGQAGKLMGLAAYGKAVVDLPLRTPTDDDNRIWLVDHVTCRNGRARIEARSRSLKSVFTDVAFPHLAGMKGEPMVYRDFAASAQASLEHIVLALAEQAAKDSRAARLVLAGGVALKLLRERQIGRVWSLRRFVRSPVSNDSGVALGAAIQSSRRRYGTSSEPTVMRHAYWGLRDEPHIVRKNLERWGFQYEEVGPNQLISEVANTLSSGGTVAWHQGRAEVGPPRSRCTEYPRRPTLAVHRRCD